MTESEIILQKALVGSSLDSSQWNQIQAGLRNRAFFSSRVAEVNILAAMRDKAAEYARGETDLSKIRMGFRDELRRMHYAPEAGKEGTIHDLFSQARIDVIVKTNVAQARGYMQYAEGMGPGAFAAFPAQEFTRVAERSKPRKDWPQRWKAAGGRTFGGRMIALKDDPVWTNLSVFGNPYPPFDWGSGMGVMDVDADTAIELGLIDKAGIKSKVRELRENPLPDFNAAKLAKLSKEEQQMIDEAQKAKWDEYAIHKAAIDTGRNQKAREMAEKMVLKNRPVEEITDFTELSEADVLAIKAALGKA
ncbi:hypothetical protein [Fibrobacter sp.]|uniref:hypothetical protein n=1 Tax=Fibrobacter sp. TaxID=35828 RepID=UPI0025BD3DC9|nr:hypothetical protein [Fibrobacter sp.]MBR3072148.1 hypothetical protein [Fibrobacter sp.]